MQHVPLVLVVQLVPVVLTVSSSSTPNFLVLIYSAFRASHIFLATLG